MEHLCPRDHGRPARGTPSRRLPPDAGVAQATRRSRCCALCSPSANSSIIFLLKALMSSGLRLVSNPMSVTLLHRPNSHRHYGYPCEWRARKLESSRVLLLLDGFPLGIAASKSKGIVNSNIGSCFIGDLDFFG